MLLLKSSGGGGGGGPGDVVDGMLVDDDDDDDNCSPDVVSPSSASTPSRGIRNFFRKRHKSVTIGCVRCRLVFRLSDTLEKYVTDRFFC